MLVVPALEKGDVYMMSQGEGLSHSPTPNFFCTHVLVIHPTSGGTTNPKESWSMARGSRTALARYARLLYLLAHIQSTGSAALQSINMI
jgi:hypothetical protein